jgi:hypothetical protein
VTPVTPLSVKLVGSRSPKKPVALVVVTGWFARGRIDIRLGRIDRKVYRWIGYLSTTYEWEFELYTSDRHRD